ncbi:MAG: nucleotidyltransferase domain-containing protein [Candidatus Jordarchaeales archaeon]
MEGLSFEELMGRLDVASRELKRFFGGAYAGLMLFGSWARGEAGEKSDVDVLVVLRGAEGLRVRGEVYRVLARHVGRPLTLVDVELSEVSRDNFEVTPLLLNALYDGVVVYDEFGVLGALKQKTAKLVKKARLTRYRTPDGKYGWRRVDGKPLEAVEV